MSKFPDRPYANFDLPSLENFKKQELARCAVFTSIATLALGCGAHVARVVLEANLPLTETAFVLTIPGAIAISGSTFARSGWESLKRSINVRDETKVRYLILTGQLSEPSSTNQAQGLPRPSFSQRALSASEGMRTLL